MQASPEASPGQPPCQITATRTRHGRLLHTLGGARRQHTHRAHTIPLAKEPVHPPPLSPATPTGRSDYTPDAGAATLAGKGPGHTHGRPRDPAGRTGGAGRDRRDGRGGGCSLLAPPSRPPLRPFPARESAVNAPLGAPPARASPKRSSPPPSGARSRPPLGLWLETDQAGTSGAHRGGSGGGGVCGRCAAARRCGRGGRAGGAATPESHRRGLVLDPEMCRRGAPAH